MIIKNYKQLLFFFICATISINAMNLLQPYDTLIRPPFTGDYPWQMSVYGEYGFNTIALDSCGECANVLRIWQGEQNALKMLEGFNDSSQIGQKRVQVDANDDGTRGHFLVSGDLDLDYSFAVAMRYAFLPRWSIGLYLPFFQMKLKNVCWEDLTKNITNKDARVKEFLTDDFFTNVCELGGLDLTGWKRTGVGDLVAMLEWYEHFPQRKPMLKDVKVNWRFGFNIPSGKRKDEDKLFALPFGYDGGLGLIFGLGLDLTFGRYLKAGVDVQLTHVFGDTRNRRIKTQKDQTELLLLEKTSAYKDFGLIQRFNLYFELYKVWKGFSLKTGYQFLKRGDDTLSLLSQDYSTEIANTALSLEEITMHHFIMDASYDFGEHIGDNARVSPYLGLFVRIPFNGKRVALNRTIGAVFALNF